MTSMIERVARAIYASEGNTVARPPEYISQPAAFDDEADDERATYFIYARAAIEAMREPTEGMAKAGADAGPTFDDDRGGLVQTDHEDASAVWNAMIDVALAGPVERP